MGQSGVLRIFGWLSEGVCEIALSNHIARLERSRGLLRYVGELNGFSS
jgi:hypothetical protein